MIPFLSSRNRRLYIKITPLIENKEESSVLALDVASGAGSISVANINKFAVNKILLIGEPGEEKSEIIKTHASSAPSGSTVTLASNTVFAHPFGTRVYIIEYDQVEFSHSTTVAGSKTLLTTTIGSGLVALEADEINQVYRETEFTTGYYFARFKNSIGSTFGGYTDAIPAAGFAENTAGYIIEQSLSDSKTKLNDELTIDWCFAKINAGIKNIQGKLKRWPKHQSLNANIGTTSAGENTVAMPTDIYDKDTNKSLLAVRIGSGSDLVYLDPDDYEQFITALVKTTVSTQAAVGDTSLVLSSANDLADAGSIDVFVSGTKYTITYTGITRATNTLTGIPASGTGSITVITPVSSNVYQNAQFGAPSIFTVRNQYIEYYPIINDSHDYNNIYADYWTVATSVDSEADEIDSDRFDMLKYWLTWHMRAKTKNEGKLDMQDGDYLLYKESLNDSIRTSVNGRRSKMVPKVNGISYRGAGWKKNFRPPQQ